MTERIIAPIFADWRILVDNNGKNVGVCYANSPAPFESFSYKRGFPLTAPTNVRCCLYSLSMAMEIVLTQVESLKDKNYLFTIVCKNHYVYENIFGTKSRETRMWAQSSGNQGARKVCGYSKPYIINVLSMYDYLRELNIGEVIYIEPEAETADLLTKKVVNVQVDPETDLDDKNGVSGEDELQARVDMAKKKEMLRKELLELGTTVRASRPKRKLTKKEKQQALIAMTKK